MSPNQADISSLSSLLQKLAAAGFEATQEGDRIRVKRGSCAAVIERRPDGSLSFSEGPGYLVGGLIARLEDRGFQKFLVTANLTIPALAEHLKQVREFSTELNAALGLPELYNQSLGTVSNRYAYDRLRGRDSR